MRTIERAQSAAGFRFAVVVSRYHDFVTDRLLEGALAALTSAGAETEQLTVVRVPGAFEIPIAAQLAAESGEYDAIICLGCLVRGETPHFDVIASAVSHALSTAGGATGVPMSFGVLTTNSIEEALERAGEGPSNKGWEAAAAAIDMAAVVAQLTRKTPAR